MNAHLIAAFADELEKNAAVPKLLKSIWGSGAGRALLGGAAGAGTGALADPENRVRGALLGGAIGAGGGYASPLLTSAGRKRAGEALRHFGRKTKHEITGLGRAPIKKGTPKAEARLIRQAEKAGLTSVPGVVKGMATRPLQTMKGAWKHSDRLGKIMAVGDVAMGVPHVMDTSTQAGVGEKALGTVGSAGGYLLGGRMGALGSMAMGGGLGFLGARAGRLFGGGKKKRTEGALEQVPTRPTVQFAKQHLEEAVPEVGRLVGPSRRA